MSSTRTIEVDTEWLIEAGVLDEQDAKNNKTIEVDEDWLEEVRRTLASQKVDAAWLAKIRGGLTKKQRPPPLPPPPAVLNQFSSRQKPPPLPRDE
ncbi:MAG: hypothetical protein RMJ98_10310 [Myxococcales bacterium]|nr:hypothetical protein [Polyangiaceae bacterium]MDW8249680.1 hypothetical protein [Myxococcales bacterium]